MKKQITMSNITQETKDLLKKDSIEILKRMDKLGKDKIDMRVYERIKSLQYL